MPHSQLVGRIPLTQLDSSGACGLQDGRCLSRAHRHSPEPATLLLALLAGGLLGQEEMASVQEGNASVLPSDCTLKFVF